MYHDRLGLTILHAGNGRSANHQEWFINIVSKKKNLFKPPHRLILGKKVKNKKEDTEREGERQRDRNEKAEALKALGRICVQ